MQDSFGQLTDYFALTTSERAMLELVSSDSGAARVVVETAGSAGSGSSLRLGRLAIQSADSAVGGFSAGGILLNPVCTYRIKAPGNFTLSLGKAYGRATLAGASPYVVTRSGFMLVSGEYITGADQEPLLTLRGVANEGYTISAHGIRSAALTDAINQWSVNLNVSPDHAAQDPFSAVSGGGELVRCKSVVTCDPVVPYENAMPCASDVVRGRVIVSAETSAYFGESAPTARSPFVEVNGVPAAESDVDFTMYSFSAERSL